jgi:hypothetical protein
MQSLLSLISTTEHLPSVRKLKIYRRICYVPNWQSTLKGKKINKWNKKGRFAGRFSHLKPSVVLVDRIGGILLGIGRENRAERGGARRVKQMDIREKRTQEKEKVVRAKFASAWWACVAAPTSLMFGCSNEVAPRLALPYPSDAPPSHASSHGRSLSTICWPRPSSTSRTIPFRVLALATNLQTGAGSSTEQPPPRAASQATAAAATGSAVTPFPKQLDIEPRVTAFFADERYSSTWTT